MNGTSINETTFVSQIPNIINEENFTIAAEQGKESALILSDEFCEEQTFPYFSRGVNSPIMLREIFQQVMLGTSINGCRALISTLHQMQIVSFLAGLCMSSTTYVHQ